MPTAAEQRAALTSLGISYPEVSAASLRGPMRGEVLTIAITANTTRKYVIPTAWLGKLVNVLAHGADVYLQISTSTDANVDPDAVAVETLVASTDRYTLAPSASGNGCWVIFNGQWQPIWFPPASANGAVGTFAVRAAVACKLRTHLAET